VEEYRERRSHVQGDVEGQPQLLRIELERVGDEDEVRGRAHRQEFGQPLHQAEDDGSQLVAHELVRATYRMVARAARSASWASFSWPSTTSRPFAIPRRWPASRNRIATDASNGLVPSFPSAYTT